jgi:hypothetical protein
MAQAAATENSVRTISSILRQLASGRLEMMCPRCETWTDAGLGYKNLQMVKEHQSALNPIVKCMSCGHTFSPKWLSVTKEI